MYVMGIEIKTLLRRLRRRLLGTITHFETDEHVVALTFDDGPHVEYTPRLLAILEKHNALATFFMVGKRAAQQRELIQRIAEAGHTIANHSWDHPRFTTISGPQRREQIRACRRALAPHGKRFFRAPWGKLDAPSRRDALFLRHEVIGWDLEVNDWMERDPHRMAELLTDRAHPGSIILLHDAVWPGNNGSGGMELHQDREAMFQALTLFLERKGREFRFVTLPEMFRLGRPVRKM